MSWKRLRVLLPHKMRVCLPQIALLLGTEALTWRFLYLYRHCRKVVDSGTFRMPAIVGAEASDAAL